MNKMKSDEAITLDVPEAGRIYFGLGRSASYSAARNGQMPCIKIGGRYRVVVRALEEMLDRVVEKSRE